MPKVCITGTTRGIGKIFADHFESKGWEVVKFNNLNNVIDQAIGCDLFINNAYASGIQINFLNELHGKVNRMVVCGSVAAFYPDPSLPEYSNHKKELAKKVKELNDQTILMLHLSAKGYNDHDALLKIIDLWLEHPCITEVYFDPTGEPNG